MRDFDAQGLYRVINSNGDDHISASELTAFLTSNFVKDVTETDCLEIIREFDSSNDNSMQYDEYLNLVMPAANANLRDYCLYGRRSSGGAVSAQAIMICVRILEGEMRLTAKKRECRIALAAHADHEAQKTFNMMSQGRYEVSVPALI